MFRVDLRQVKELAEAAGRAAREFVRRAAERGAELTRAELKSGRLREGVRAEAEGLEGRVVAELFDARPAGPGVLHLPSGRTKEVSLRASPGTFNVLQGIATGTGLYGPKGRVIRPNKARVLLIETDEVEPGEAFIAARGRRFVLRPRSSGVRPDDYPGRAADRLETELPVIARDSFGREGL